MSDSGRVVTTKLPNELFVRLDEAARHLERSKSWIVREAVFQWLAEEQRRFDLTVDALNSVREGRTVSHEDAVAHFDARRNEKKL